MNTFSRFVLIVCLSIIGLAYGTAGAQSYTPAHHSAPTPTATPTRTPTPNPRTALVRAQRNETGGYAFEPVAKYDLTVEGGVSKMLAPKAAPDLGPFITLTGKVARPMTNQELFDSLAKDSGGLKFGEPQAADIQSVAGLTAEVSGKPSGQAVKGRVYLAMITQTQQFALLAAGPASRWNELEPLVRGVLDSLNFFPPAGGSERGSSSDEAKKGWHIFSNANAGRDVSVYENVAYTATLGGVVAWDLSSGQPVKYTPLQGTGHISAHAVTVCDLTSASRKLKGILVGSLSGLSFFDPASKIWDRRDLAPTDSRVQLNRIDRVLCDNANNRLLIGYNGLGVLDLTSQQWKHYTDQDGLSWNAVTDIAVAGKDIWIASGHNGVSRIHNGQVTVYNEANGLPNPRAGALAAGADGTVWAGTAGGLASFKNEKWTFYPNDPQNGLNGDISELEIGPDGSLWVASAALEGGMLGQFDPKQGVYTTLYKEPGSNPILGLALDESGKPVYATDRGLFRWDGQNSRAFVLPGEQLASNFVATLGSDPQGMLWVGTDRGLQRLDPANPEVTWQIYRSAADGSGPGGNWASAVAFGRNNAAWFTFVNGAASRFQDGQWRVFKDIFSYDTLTVDAQGRAWFGDDKNGVSVLDENGQELFKLDAAGGLPSGNVRSLLASGDTVWIGTSDGLAKYQGGKLSVVFAKDSPQLGYSDIACLANERNNALLIGTAGSIVRYENGAASLLLDLRKTYNGSLNRLVVAPNGRIWAGSSVGLLYSDNGVDWTLMTTADGLPTNNVTALQIDNLGGVWVGGGSTFDGGGLLHFTP